MAWDRSSGRFNRNIPQKPYSGQRVWRQSFIAREKVNAPDHDAHDNDLADGISECLNKNGANAAESDLRMGGNKHLDVADATAGNEYATLGQVAEATSMLVPDSGVGAATGNANHIILTPQSGTQPTVYLPGRSWRWIAKATNTDADVQVQVGGLASLAVVRPDGQPLQNGDIVQGEHVAVVYDGTRFRLVGGGVGGGGGGRVVTAGTPPAAWAERDNPTGTVPSERIAASPSTGKVLYSGSGAGEVATWVDPFSASKPALFASASESAMLTRFRMPKSRPGTNAKVQLQWASVTGGESFESPPADPDVNTGLTRTVILPAGTTERLIPSLTNGTRYKARCRGVIGTGSSAEYSQWSDDALSQAQGGCHRVTTPGTTTFLWPWEETFGRAILYGAGGAGGGAGFLEAQGSLTGSPIFATARIRQYLFSATVRVGEWYTPTPIPAPTNTSDWLVSDRDYRRNPGNYPGWEQITTSTGEEAFPGRGSILRRVRIFTIVSLQVITGYSNPDAATDFLSVPEDGGAGGDTVITVAGVGRVANGGSGGEKAASRSNEENRRFAFGNGGDGGHATDPDPPAASLGLNMLHNGFPGGPGDVREVPLTGMAIGTQIGITVGAGGTAGPLVKRGRYDNFTPGGDGGDGLVIIIPGC